MAVVFPRKVKELSRLPGVKAVVRAQAEVIAARSSAILAAHSGPSHGGTRPTITVVSGRVDSYVCLNDADGGVLSIEYGRTGGAGGGAMAPIAPLRGGLA